MFCCGICKNYSDDDKTDISKYDQRLKARKKKKKARENAPPKEKKESAQSERRSLKDMLQFRRSSDSYEEITKETSPESYNSENEEKEWPPIGCVSLSAPQTPDFRPRPGPPDELAIPPPTVSIWRLMWPPHNPNPRKKRRRRPRRPPKKKRKKKKPPKYRTIKPCVVKYYSEDLYDIPAKYRPYEFIDEPYSEFWKYKHLTVQSPLEFPEGCISLSSPKTKDFRESSSTISVLETPPPPCCNYKDIPIQKIRSPSPSPEPIPEPPVPVLKLMEKAPKRPPKFRGKVAPCNLQDIRREFPGYTPCPPEGKRKTTTSTTKKFISETQSPEIESSIPINFTKRPSSQAKFLRYK
ncbi:extensin-like [Cimex lectularius]|uniref:Uncharacterized protein n=1 Tax=Cimex lectularius TaxID=79782 RepID=A0A8I6S225_CIMLE|nr:extensin-like [Cimex lectularius]